MIRVGLGRTAPVATALALACGGLNRPPDVAPIGPLDVTVGETLSVPLRAEDPEGGRVTFEVHGGPEGASIERGPDGDRFVCSPLASDAKPGGARFELTFTASDPDGGSTSVKTLLTIWPEGSVPAFEGPFAFTVNLATTDRLSVRIRVRDDDTARLGLRLVRPLDGAVFEVVDGHTASVYWKPRPAQIAAGPVHTFAVGALDGEHPEVVADFAVVLVNPDLFGGCPGTAPLGRHVPTGDVRGGGAVDLSLSASDPESRVRSATLFWSAVQGARQEDFNPVEAGEAAPGRFEASIPDLSSAAQDGLLVFYHFEADDDDDSISSACDHLVRVPKIGEFAVAVYASATADCLDDSLCRRCGEANPAPLPEGTVAGLRLCGEADHFLATVPAGGSVAVVARPMSLPDPPVVRVVGPGGEVLASGPGAAIAGLDAGGDVRVEVRPPPGVEMTYELSAATFPGMCAPDPSVVELGIGTSEGTVCPGEVDRWAFSLQAGEAAALALTFDAAAADLDLLVYDASGDLVAASAGTVGPEQVTIEAQEDAAYEVRVAAVGLGSSPYALDVRVETHAGLCQDDLLAPNASAAEAATVPEGEWPNLKLCPGTADHVRFGLNGGELLRASVAPRAGAPEMPALAILDADGAVLASGIVTGEVATAEVVAPGPGDFFVRVGPAAGALEVPYSLSFLASDPPGGCIVDRLEPNDEVEGAPALPAGYTTHLTLCPGDRDVFSFRLAEWEPLSVVVLAGTAFTRSVLLGPDGAVVAQGMPTSYGEELFFLAKENGPCWLVVEPQGGPGWYDVGVEGE